jgi:DNA-binding MarR family transcriptional regulator
MNKCIAGALIQAAKRLEKRFEDALAEVDLSIAKYAALTALVQGKEAVSLSEMAERLTCVRSNITQLVDRLEADGLAKRTHDPLDRRSVRAEATPLGVERQAVGEKIMIRIQDEITRDLNAEERQNLERILDNI